MNKTFSFALLGIALIVSTLSAFAADAPPVPFYDTPNFTNSIASGGTSTRPNSAHVPIDIPPRSIWIMQATLYGANAGTSNTVAKFNTTLKGESGWTTTASHTATFTMNGTNPVTAIVIIGTNIPARFASLDQWTTTQTNAVTVTNIVHAFLPMN